MKWSWFNLHTAVNLARHCKNTAQASFKCMYSFEKLKETTVSFRRWWHWWDVKGLVRQLLLSNFFERMLEWVSWSDVQQEAMALSGSRHRKALVISFLIDSFHASNWDMPTGWAGSAQKRIWESSHLGLQSLKPTLWILSWTYGDDLGEG